MTQEILKVLYTVRIILVNPENKILLMSIIDPDTNEKYWFPIGGKIEKNETRDHAVIRELFEETGLTENDIIEKSNFFHKEEFQKTFKGVETTLKQDYIRLRTNNYNLSTKNFSEEEKKVFQEFKWFSLEEIGNYPEKIYPKNLLEILAKQKH